MSVKDRMMNAIVMKDEVTRYLIESEVPEAELITEIIAQQKILVLLPHADESNIERWEKSLNVKAVSVDLEERRRYLLTLISSKLKVNTDTLAELSQRFTGVQALVEVEFEGNTNLIKKSRDFNGSIGVAPGITKEITSEGYLKVVASQSNGNYMSLGLSSGHYTEVEKSLTEDEEFTISFDMKRLEGHGIPKVYIKREMGYFQMSGNLGSDFSLISYTGRWKKQYPFQLHLGWQYAPGAYLIRSMKLERGRNATPHNLNPSESGYRHREAKILIKFLGQLPQVSLNRFTNYIKALIPANLGVQIGVSAPMTETMYLYGYHGISVSALKFE